MSPCWFDGDVRDLLEPVRDAVSRGGEDWLVYNENLEARDSPLIQSQVEKQVTLLCTLQSIQLNLMFKEVMVRCVFITIVKENAHIWQMGRNQQATWAERMCLRFRNLCYAVSKALRTNEPEESPCWLTDLGLSRWNKVDFIHNHESQIEAHSVARSRSRSRRRARRRS